MLLSSISLSSSPTGEPGATVAARRPMTPAATSLRAGLLVFYCRVRFGLWSFAVPARRALTSSARGGGGCGSRRMPLELQLLWGAVGFLAALFVGTLVEYLGHRFMHGGLVLGKVHAEHHRDGFGQGWLLEFKDYLVGTFPVVAAGILIP